MKLYDVIINSRTIRKFTQEEIPHDTIETLIDGAHYAPSAANLQPIKYMIVEDENTRDKVFSHLDWATYIKPNGTPKEGERPVAYIVVLIDKTIKSTGYELLDIGLAVQNIKLLASEQGIGSCIIAAMNKKKVQEILNIKESYELKIIIALGYKGENPVIEDATESIKYYKDCYGVLHVPKRKIEEIIIK